MHSRKAEIGQKTDPSHNGTIVVQAVLYIYVTHLGKFLPKQKVED